MAGSVAVAISSGAPGAAAGAGPVAHDSLFSDATQPAGLPITLSTYVDLFAGSTISPPSDGDYIIILELVCTPSGNSKGTMAVGLNSTTVAQAKSERSLSKDAQSGGMSTTKITGLVTTDTISGIAKVDSGATLTFDERHLWMIRVG